jgi:uncharacterized protein (DUF608 family)
MGALSHFSLRHKPEVANAPCVFSALKIKGEKEGAKILEGPVADWKVMYPFNAASTGNGNVVAHFGLPRFERASFLARFPFGEVELRDESIPLEVSVTGWSPFIERDSKNSSLPVAGLEYRFKNTTSKTVEATYSFNSKNFMACGGEGGDSVCKIENGFLLAQAPGEDYPEREGYFIAQVVGEASVNPAWFRGGWFDSLTMLWKDIESGDLVENAEYDDESPSPGASLFVPLIIPAGGEKIVRLMLSWYVPNSDICVGESCACDS